MQTPPQEKEALPLEAALSIGYQDIVEALLERAWITVLFLVVGIFCGISYINNSPKLYSSKVVLYIEPPKLIVNIPEVSKEDARNSEATQNMMQLMRAKPLGVRVAKAGGFGRDAAFWGVAQGEVKYSDEETANRIKGMLEPIQRKGSTYIDLYAEHGDPAVAQRVCDLAAEELIKLNIANRLGTSEQAYEFLNNQLSEVKQQLALSEEALQAYRQKYGEGSMDTEDMRDNNAEFNKIKRGRLLLEADLSQIEKYKKDPEKLLSLRSIEQDSTVQVLQGAIAKKSEAIAAMTQRYTEKHPKLMKARSELISLQKSINKAALDAVEGIEPRYQLALSQEKNMSQMAITQRGGSIQYNALHRQVESNRQLYEAIYTRISETKVTRAIDFDNVRIIERATFEPIPFKPDKRKIMMASLAGGLLAGIAISMLLHSFDSSVKTVDQSEIIFRLPVLAAIPEARGKAPVRKGVVSPIDEVSPAVRESFRTMLVSMSLLGRKEEGRICLFTSAVPAEGKTYCSYHCAAHLAGQGARTLLVDADLRKPFLHQMITKGVLGAGVTEALTDQKSFDEVLQFTNIENLFFVSAGIRSPNPPKLLINNSFQRLVDAYRDKFDYIIFDSAPVNAVADTLLMVQHVQRICLITRAGSTPRKATLRAIEFLRQAGREASGMVLNRFKDRRGLYYYYHYSYHKSYGKESAYGADKKST